MAGRVLAFADPEVAGILRGDFVAVAGDDWYRRRQEDDVGKFFRAVADQGPRKGEGGSTRQGLYIITSSGKLLAFRNTADPAGVKDLLLRGLKAWKQLPAADRAPKPAGAAPSIDPRFERVPPAGGIVLRVHARELDRLDAGGYERARGRPSRQDLASLDHAWLRKEDWQSLAPARPEPGLRWEVPEALALRLARFHLVDNTRGEPEFWRRSEVRKCSLALRVAAVEADKVVLLLEGAVHLETKDSSRGYEARVGGVLEYDLSRRRVTRFDAVAVGDHWGESTYTRGARASRAPFGVAFRLAGGADAADRVPPQAARDLGGYLGG